MHLYHEEMQKTDVNFQGIFDFFLFYKFFCNPEMNGLWTALPLISLGRACRYVNLIFNKDCSQLSCLWDHSHTLHFLPHFRWGFHTLKVFFFPLYFLIYLFFRVFAWRNSSRVCVKFIFANDKTAVLMFWVVRKKNPVWLGGFCNHCACSSSNSIRCFF